MRRTLTWIGSTIAKARQMPVMLQQLGVNAEGRLVGHLAVLQGDRRQRLLGKGGAQAKAHPSRRAVRQDFVHFEDEVVGIAGNEIPGEARQPVADTRRNAGRADDGDALGAPESILSRALKPTK